MHGNGRIGQLANGFNRVISELPKYLKYNYKIVTKDDINILKRLKRNDDLVICKLITNVME